MSGSPTAYTRMQSRRGSNSSSFSNAPSLLRILGLSIVALGLLSLSLQGYGIGQQRHAAAVDSEPSLLRAATDREPVHALHESVHAQEEEDAENAVHGDSAVAQPCYDERDWGLIRKIQASKREFCTNKKEGSTSVTYFNASRGGFRATLFDRLVLDLRGAKVFRPIKSIAQDGGKHDPRFQFTPSIVQCECEPLHAFARAFKAEHIRTINVWAPTLAKMPTREDPPSTVCAAGGPASQVINGKHVEIQEKTLIIARKDDHNPFFQVSNALNAWILTQVLGWKPEETRVVHLDGGFPSPVDALHRKLLSPRFPLLKAGDDFPDKLVEFTNAAAIVPYEVSGPMMQHLNDFEPCQASTMLQTFRDDAMRVMDLPALPVKRTQITVTVITRRNYGGRRVQRTWRNEKEILDQMRELYKVGRASMPIVFQSIDFVNLTLQEQMWIIQNSDVVIGMHGAGMVNVMWARPQTLVVEIFPKKRFRWGYRNLCQYLGCAWREFRGGEDTGKGDNNSHKTIPWDEWHGFFGPLFQDALSRIGSEER